MKVIRSSGNAQFRSLLKLKDSARERRRAGSTLLEGRQLVAAYVEQVGAPLVMAVSESALNIPDVQTWLANLSHPEPVVLSDGLIRELSSVTTPPGVVAAVPIPAPRAVPHDVTCCLLLENVQDPGNLGSLLRTAAAAGVRHIVLSRGCTDPWAPRVLRGAMGAHPLLLIEERADIEAYARAYRGQVVATVAKARRTIYDIDLTAPTAFVFGNEAAGLSEAMLQQADSAAQVPLAPGIESLNVGAAAAVCLFERVRQLRAARAKAKNPRRGNQ